MIKKTGIHPAIGGMILSSLFMIFSYTTVTAQYWQLDKTIDGVELYHSIITCNNSNAVLLRFVNNNDHDVDISWKEVFTTQQVPEKKEGNNGKKQLRLVKGETFASGCNESRNRKCLVLPGEAIPTYAATIRSFEFKDISVVRAR